MTRKPKSPTPAAGVIRAGAEKLRSAAGQGYSDPCLRALAQLEAVCAAADAVIEAKDLYYQQRVDNDDALDLALLLWADRTDALGAALRVAQGEVSA